MDSYVPMPPKGTVLPSTIQWQARSAGEVEKQKVALPPGAKIKLRTPWWLKAEVGGDHIHLRPRVHGTFRGQVRLTIGQQHEVAEVHSSIPAEPASRRVGAASAFIAALAGSIIALLGTLVLSIPYIAQFVALLWCPICPLLVLAPMGVAIGGKRFLFKVLFGWIVGLAAAGIIFFSIVTLGEATPVLLKDGETNRSLVCWLLFAGGAVAGTLAAWPLSPKLRFLGLFAGAACAGGLLFAWRSDWGLRSDLPTVFIVQVALTFPFLMSAPVIGAHFGSIPVPPTPAISMRGLALWLLVLFTVPLGILYAYQFKKPSAFRVRDKPAKASVQFGSNSAPGSIVWEMPLEERVFTNFMKISPGQRFNDILPSPTSSDVYVMHGKITKLDENERSLLQIEPGGAGSVMSSRGVLSFFLGEVLFAFQHEQKLWSRQCPSQIRQIFLDGNENLIVLGSAHVESLTPQGKPRWSYPKPPRWLEFEYGAVDRFGTLYAAAHHENSLFIFERDGTLRRKITQQIPDSLPRALSVIDAPNPVLVAGSLSGSRGFDGTGRQLFASTEPFHPFGSVDRLCYGTDHERSIFTMDAAGEKKLLYQSSELLIGRVLLANRKIYALSKGRLQVIALTGELERTFQVTDKMLSLMAVKNDRIYGFSESSALAVQDVHKSVP